MKNTTNQGVPYVDLDDTRYSVPSTTEAMAAFIDTHVVMRFDSVSDRTSKLNDVGGPEQGMVSVLLNTSSIEVYLNGDWHQVFPPKPAVSSGDGAPTGSGSAGDLYVEY